MKNHEQCRKRILLQCKVQRVCGQALSEVQHHTGRSVKGRDCKAGVLILYGDVEIRMCEETRFDLRKE